MTATAAKPIPPSSTPSTGEEGALAVFGGLEPHTRPLTTSDVQHVFRRCMFGATPQSVAAWAGASATDLARQLVQSAQDLPLPEPPSWANEPVPTRGTPPAEAEAYRMANQQWTQELRLDWASAMLRDGFRERMALVWHNHFVTGITAYRWAVLAHRYLQTLRSYGLGNFKEFVHAIGLDPAMLVYLNGIQNRQGAPNENYARELLELFTMGPQGPDGTPNYSEDDVRELARALTGWQVSNTSLSAVFAPNLFDSGIKTILGESGAFGYDQVVDLLFQTRADQIAHFVSTHLYRSLVYHIPHPEVVSQMAALLQQEDFELGPLVETLISSVHFLDPLTQGAQIKSPVDHGLSLLIETGTPPAPPIVALLERTARLGGQVLLDPPNVAGWPGHHEWMDTTRLPFRWVVSEALLSGRGAAIDLIALAEQIHDPLDPEAAFRLPLALVTHLIPVSPDLLDIPEITDPFGGDLTDFPIPEWVQQGPAHVSSLAKMFLGGLPWYEWNLYGAGAQERIAALVRQLTQYPEYQLT